MSITCYVPATFTADELEHLLSNQEVLDVMESQVKIHRIRKQLKEAREILECSNQEFYTAEAEERRLEEALASATLELQARDHERSVAMKRRSIVLWHLLRSQLREVEKVGEEKEEVDIWKSRGSLVEEYGDVLDEISVLIEPPTRSFPKTSQGMGFY